MKRDAFDQVQLVCEECGAVGDAGPSVLGPVTGRLEDSCGFQARVVQATVFGRCVHCQTGGDRS
jgi:Fe2+ or Zn2+ uptake regulation protein